MYSIGEFIIYGGEGVCRVESIGPPPISSMDQSRTYYTLQPLYHGGTIYAPTDVSIMMRPVLSRDEAMALINDIPNMPSDFEYTPDAKQAAAEYKLTLQTYDCANLLHLIRLIYSKNIIAITAGKSYGQTDDRFLKRAKELLYGELAISLGIPMDEVESAIVALVSDAGIGSGRKEQQSLA